VVERVGGGDGADEDEHDQSHALLPVIGAVRKADAGAGKDQQGANGPRWRRVAFGRSKEHIGILDHDSGAQGKEEQTDDAHQKHDSDQAGGNSTTRKRDRLPDGSAQGTEEAEDERRDQVHHVGSGDSGDRDGGKRPQGFLWFAS
jgi:hypothetical protein